MAIRLAKAIIRGELSNETRDCVTGRFWLLGRAEPLELTLQGNCLRDLAGCRLKFVNPAPQLDAAAALLSTEQTGVTGDITASRKSCIPTVGDQELMRLIENQLPIPTRVANSLYIEWFSETNGRVVVESADFELEVTVADWPMDAPGERAQSRVNQDNFHHYLDTITGGQLDDDDEEFEDEEEEDDDDFDNMGGEGESDGISGEALEGIEMLIDGELDEDEEEDDDEDEGPPLNEFEWEQELREADRRAEAYQEAFDRYRDHPQRERLIAEAMGWEPEEVEEFREDWQDVTESLQPHDPDDLIESADSFAQDEEDMHHPMSRRAMNFALRLQREAAARGLLADGASRDTPVLSVIVNIIALGGKLAAALDGTMHGYDPEPGFVIAMLKRAQVPLNEALHSISSVSVQGLSHDTRNWLTTTRNELFELRKDILDLMRDLRMR